MNCCRVVMAVAPPLPPVPALPPVAPLSMLPPVAPLSMLPPVASPPPCAAIIEEPLPHAAKVVARKRTFAAIAEYQLSTFIVASSRGAVLRPDGVELSPANADRQVG